MLEPIQELAGRIAAVIINPFLALVFAAGFMLFLFGLVKYLYGLNVKGGDEPEGKAHMFWGLLGMFVMVAAYTIIRLVANTINVQLPPGY